MPNLTIRRDDQNAERTYGVLYGPESFTCQTLELPWLDDRPDISCAKAMVYSLDLTYSPHFGFALFELTGDTARSGERVHSANIPAQLLGCVALGGSRESRISGVPNVHTGGFYPPADGVTNSRAALDSFMTAAGIPSYRELITPQLVAQFLATHPGLGHFTLTILDPQ